MSSVKEAAIVSLSNVESDTLAKQQRSSSMQSQPQFNDSLLFSISSRHGTDSSSQPNAAGIESGTAQHQPAAQTSSDGCRGGSAGTSSGGTMERSSTTTQAGETVVLLTTAALPNSIGSPLASGSGAVIGGGSGGKSNTTESSCELDNTLQDETAIIVETVVSASTATVTAPAGHRQSVLNAGQNATDSFVSRSTSNSSSVAAAADDPMRSPTLNPAGSSSAVTADAEVRLGQRLDRIEGVLQRQQELLSIMYKHMAASAVETQQQMVRQTQQQQQQWQGAAMPAGNNSRRGSTVSALGGGDLTLSVPRGASFRGVEHGGPGSYSRGASFRKRRSTRRSQVSDVSMFPLDDIGVGGGNEYAAGGGGAAMGTPPSPAGFSQHRNSNSNLLVHSSELPTPMMGLPQILPSHIGVGGGPDSVSGNNNHNNYYHVPPAGAVRRDPLIDSPLMPAALAQRRVTIESNSTATTDHARAFSLYNGNGYSTFSDDRRLESDASNFSSGLPSHLRTGSNVPMPSPSLRPTSGFGSTGATLDAHFTGGLPTFGNANGVSANESPRQSSMALGPHSPLGLNTSVSASGTGTGTTAAGGGGGGGARDDPDMSLSDRHESHDERTKSISMTHRARKLRQMQQAMSKDDSLAAKAKVATVTTYNLEDYPIIFADILYMVFSCIGCIANNMELFQTWTSPPLAHVIVLIALTEAYGLLWTLMRFRIRVRKGPWEIVRDHLEIRKNYLRSWFAFDLVLALPIEFIFIHWSNVMFRVLLCRHYLRWIRVLTLNNSTNPLLNVRSYFRLINFTSAVICAVHLAAEVFQYLESSSNLGFTNALYFLITTVTTTGYGDFVATTDSSRGFTNVVMVMGSFIIATMTALATDLVTTKDIHEAELETKRKMMHSMFKHYQIPWDVQHDVIKVFPAVLESQSEEQFRALINTMPPTVATSIEKYLRVKLLKSLPLFKDLGDETDSVIYALSAKLKRRFHDAFEVIICAGEPGTAMYFVGSGMLEVTRPLNEDDDIVVATLHAGAFFGEMALINDAPRTATVSTILPTELLHLHKNDFNAIRDKYKVLQERIDAEVKKRQRELREKEKEKASEEAAAQRQAILRKVKAAREAEAAAAAAASGGGENGVSTSGGGSGAGVFTTFDHEAEDLHSNSSEDGSKNPLSTPSLSLGGRTDGK